jgi:3-oxoacyl-[acyl-carrier-protein] synthase II
MIKRVVITGMGALTPVGNNLNDFWNALIHGKNGVGPITHFDASKFKTRFACEVKNFDPLDFFEKSDVKKYDPYTQYSLVASEEAIGNAEIDFDALDKNRIGVIWGSGNGGIYTYQEEMFGYAKGDGTPRFNPYLIPKMLINMAPGVISIKHGLRGINYATVSACASSNTALIDAVNYIQLGKADMIITGGAEYGVIVGAVGGFNAARALSTLNDDPCNASRPFDIKRDGFVLGEGAGALVLESLEHALKRNAPIIAEVAGTAMAADAYHMTGTEPNGEGAYLGMLAALEDAGIQPSDIDYLNAHATSTPLGDISELKATQRVFGAHRHLSISATKSMTGHMLGGAGAIESIIAIKSTQADIIPPTINTTEVEPEFADKFDFTLGKAKHKEVNYAMNNTFGFGGHIAVTIYKKWRG